MRTEPAIDKNHTRIRSPRPAEINAVAGVITSQTAAQKDKARVFFITRAVMRGHIALSFAVNRAVFKHCRCRAEYKIDMPFDVTVFEIVTTAVNEQRVLPSEKSTILKRRTIGIDE